LVIVGRRDKFGGLNIAERTVDLLAFGIEDNDGGRADDVVFFFLFGIFAAFNFGEDVVVLFGPCLEVRVGPSGLCQSPA
jgi:hypothetical protein